MPVLQSAVSLPWAGAQPVQAAVALRWGAGVNVQSIGTPYTRPPAPPGSTVLGTEPNLSPRTEILPAASYRSTAAAVVRNARVQPPDDDVIQATAGNIDLPDGSALWRLNATVPRAAYDALRAGEQPPLVSVSIAGRVWVFLVDEMSAPRAFAATDVEIRGVSLAALADAPYELARQWTSDAPTTAAQIATLAQTFTGLAVSWRLPDWPVPAGGWSFSGTPWGAVLQAAAPVLAVVEAHPSDLAVTVSSRYPVAPTEWATTAPDVQVPWQAVDSENVTAADQPAYTGVYVAGPAASIAAVRLAGTSGAEQAPLVTHEMLTDLDGQAERGRAILGASGGAQMVSRKMYVLAGAGQPGVLSRGQLVRWVDPAETWVGMVRAVRLDWEFGKVRQTVACERRTSFPVGVYVPPKPAVFRPAYLLDAPLTTDASDLADPPATPNVQNQVSFSTAGALIVWGGAGATSSGINYFGAAKINANANTNRFAMVVRIAVDPAWTGPGFNGAHRVFGFSSGPVEAAFSFWASGTVLRVYPWAYNGASIMGPGQSGAPEAVVQADSTYEIEWTGADTCRWKIDGVLFYELNFPRISSGSLYVSNGLFRSGPVPLQMTFKALRVYNGTFTGALPE